MGKRRQRRLKFKADDQSDIQPKLSENEKKAPEIRTQATPSHPNRLIDFYDKKYKLLLIIPFMMLMLAFAQIAYQYSTTGDFINRGVSLKGGTTIIVQTTQEMDIAGFEQSLRSALPGFEISAKLQSVAGSQSGIIIESGATQKEETDLLLGQIEAITGIGSDNYSVEVIGANLGASFFKQTMIALLVAFLFMGIVVFLYFRTFVPSIAVILAAFSDMVITLAIVNTLGIKLSTAGIAAFLMLIGYSIDTDILLSTRVLKRKEGTLLDRILGAAKTGLTMNFTTMAALIAGILLSRSEVLTQIMTILLIGLLVDLVNTWIQNVGILRIYLEKTEAKKR